MKMYLVHDKLSFLGGCQIVIRRFSFSYVLASTTNECSTSSTPIKTLMVLHCPSESRRLILPSCLPEMTSTWESENRKLKFTGMSVRKSSNKASCWLQTNAVLACVDTFSPGSDMSVINKIPFRKDSHSCST